MLVALAVSLALILALSLAFIASDLIDARALLPVPPREPPEVAPRVAIIVPARDEAHQIEACLKSLLAQRWPELRVVCVDDRSTDGTLEIAERLAKSDARLTVVRGAELPAGWLGKNWANAQGVQAAGQCDYFLFTDADTVHAPGALAAAVDAAERHGARLYSLFGFLEMHTFWERVLQANVIASILLAFPVRRVNDPKSGTAIANGQYLLVRREDYEALGGHAPIRDRVADDLELARLFKGSGRRIRAENGTQLLSVRMYRSLREIWWGFAKNGTAGAGGPLLAALGTVALLWALSPFALFPWALAAGHLRIAGLAGACCAAGVLQRARIYRLLFRLGPHWALLAPLGQLVFAGIMAHSIARAVTGKGPMWKGREYPWAR
jgi:chlorobactene glucosyltransferase